MADKAKLDRLESLLPKYPSERKLLTTNLIADVFGEDEEKHPNIRSLKQAKKGDLVRIKGQDAIFVERTQTTRQGRETSGIIVLREIDVEVYVCSYFEEDLA